MLNTQNNFKMYQAAKQMGEIAIASEYTMEFDDFSEMTHILKQFPVPIITPEEVIEVPMVGGLKGFTSQALKFDFRGTIAFKETMKGDVRKMLSQMHADIDVGVRPRFNATIYLGTKENHTQKWRIIDAILFGFDPIDADNENRGQHVIVSGQIAYMYFGDS